MNRHQRRQAIRDGRYQARGTDEVHQARPVTDLPAKQAGRHRWVAIGTYTLTANQAAQADAGAEVVLRPEMLVAFGIGCVDCENTYHQVRADPCPAGAEWEQT